eukprot:g14076.t1
MNSRRPRTRPVSATLDDKASLAIVLCDVLLVDTARGIFFPTLWPHVKQLGGDKIALGYCVGAFSLGRTLMSPVFGRMSTEHGYRRVLMISTTLVAFSALFYAVADGVFKVFLSQAFLGVGSGTLGVTRGYVADKTTPAQRTYLLAYTTAVQYAGFTVMPVLGGLFSYLLGSDEIPLIGRFLLLTQFTAPAFFVTVLSSAVLLLLYFVFKDGNRKQPAKTAPSVKDLPGVASGVSLVPTVATELDSNDCGSGDDVSINESSEQVGRLPGDQWPAAEYYQGDFDGGNGRGCRSVDVDEDEEGRRGDRGVGADGGSRSVVGQYVEISSDEEIDRGTIGCVSGGGGDGRTLEDVEGGYLEGTVSTGREEIGGENEPEEELREGEGSLLGKGKGGRRLARKLRLRLPSKGDLLIYGGFLLNVSTKGTISCFETIGAQYAMTNFSLSSAEAGTIFATCGAIGVIALLSMRILCRHYNDIQLVLGGVSLMILTCLVLAVPPQAGAAGLYVFVAAVFMMYSVGYPIGHTAVLGLFSKVVGAQPQGTLMGWFGSAGALARTFFPVLAGVLCEELGSSALFSFLVAILSITFGMLFTFRKPYLECVEITKRRKAAVASVCATLDDKASLMIVLFNVLLGDTARGIFFPTLWPHVKQLGGDKIALGYCVGAFSFGRTLVSPFFGKMSTERGYRRTLMVSTALVSFIALFYAVADSVFKVFLSQALLGVGSATLGVTRGYVADKTTPAQRTYLLAYLSAVQYTGVTVMPVVGGFFSYILGSKEIPLIGRFLVLNQFTAPAFFIAAMAVAIFVLLFFVFQDGIRKQQPAKTAPSAKGLSGIASGVSLVPTLATELDSNDDGSGDDLFANESSQQEGRLPEDRWPAVENYEGELGGGGNGQGGRSVAAEPEGSSSSAAVGQYVEISSDEDIDGGTIGRFSGIRGGGRTLENVEGGFQTSTVAIGTANVNGGNEKQADEAGEGEPGLLAEGGEVIGNLRYRLPSKGDMLIYGGLLLNVSTKGTIACFETIGVQYAMTNFMLSSAEAATIFSTCGAIGVVALLSMRILCRYYNDIQLVLGGVSVMALTCFVLAFHPQAGAAGLYVFVAAVFMTYSVGYPVGHTAVLGLFSKVVGAQPQGTLMGWFGSAGALARALFPVLAGVLCEELGSSALFSFLVAILSITFGVLFAFRDPYLECVEITKGRKAAVASVSPSPGVP